MRLRMFVPIGEMIMPGRFRPRLRSYYLKAGLNYVPYGLYGLLFSMSFVATLIIYFLFVFESFGNIVPLVVGTFVFIFLFMMALSGSVMLLLWMFVEIRVFQRTAKIEEVLPDFLEALSVNLRSGMTFDKALWNSVEPEFGILEKEIEIVAKKVMTGEDTQEALMDFAAKYDSPLLKESMDLLVIGIKSGGEISDLIDRVVENVKTAAFLQKELLANVMSYVIFISLIAIVVSPALFALSYNLMIIIQSLGQKLASAGGGSVFSGVEFGKELIKKSDFVAFSQACIVIINVASSAIIADLREGSIRGGIKYIFIFIILSFLVYSVMLTIFTGMFGGMV